MSFPIPPAPIAFEQALSIIVSEAARRRLVAEPVEPARASGRVLAEAVLAPADVPAFANSAMDGFAVRGADLRKGGGDELPFRLLGERFAGDASALAVGAGECVRITTGAPIPDGADTVVIKEHARVDGDLVWLSTNTPDGANVRLPGEDLRRGERLLEAGQTLDAVRIGLLATCGLPRVTVSRRPTVAVFTTGDELRAPGETLQAGQIHDSNRPMLQALLAECGIESLSWPSLPDDPARLRAALRDASEAFDLVLTCGGVSVGEHDHLPALMAEHGEILFWRIRMKPGMPVLFGRLGAGLLMALPGNPVSVLATFRQLVRPLLDALQGRTDAATPARAVLSNAVDKRHGRREYRRGRLACTDDGRLQVEVDAAIGSHRLAAAARCNALVVLPENSTGLAAGDIVEVEPWGPLLRPGAAG